MANKTIVIKIIAIKQFLDDVCINVHGVNISWLTDSHNISPNIKVFSNLWFLVILFITII